MENEEWSPRTKDIPMLPGWQALLQTNSSLIHSFNVYLLRTCYMYKAKIKQNNTMYFLYQNNTVSNKYKRQKNKEKQIEFILDDCSKTHRAKDSLLLFLQIPPGFQLFRYIVS